MVFDGSDRGPWRDLSDHELLEAAANDDERAFAAFYHRYAETVFAAALDDLGDEDEAQQIAQEVFATAWDKASRIRLSGGSAKAWLLVTCRYQVANRRRSLQRRPAWQGLDGDVANMLEARRRQRANDRAVLERVEEELAEMSELDRRVFRSIIVEGFSYEEAAHELGISMASVGKRLNRVRRRLGTRIGGRR